MNRKQFDTNPRYRYDNIASLDMDLPEKTTQVNRSGNISNATDFDSQ